MAAHMALARGSVKLWRASVAVIRGTYRCLRAASSSSAGDLPSLRAKVRKNSAVAFLEKFRHGPETQSEWNLLLWRVTFPLVTLMLCTFLAVVGKALGLAVYSLLVCPVWYFCNFALAAYPFLLVFRFPELDERAQWRLWQILAAASAAISAVEWYMSVPGTRYAWIVGNTLFGIMALAAIPMFFRLHRRVARAHYDALVAGHDDDSDEVQEEIDSSPFVQVESTEPEPWTDAASTHRVERVQLHEMDVYSPGATPPATPRRSAEASMFGSSTDPGRVVQDSNHVSEEESSSSQRRLKYLCGACAAVVWLAMFTSYSSSRGTATSTRVWFLLYMLSPVLCIVLVCSRGARHTRFSFDYLVLYSVLIVHVPIFLGHFCVRLFTLAEAAGVDDPTSSWLQLGVSIIFLLLMQGYFFILTLVVNRMSEPFSHPSLLYIGQLYYYLFWYILVGSDTPIDLLYWGMLLVSNVHIALLNTGVYTDFKQTSTGWLSGISAISCLSFPVAMCLRASPPLSRSIGRCSVQKAGGSSVFAEPSTRLEDGGGDDDDAYSVLSSSSSFSSTSSRLRAGSRVMKRASEPSGAWRSGTRSEDVTFASIVPEFSPEKARAQSASTPSISSQCSNAHTASTNCCRNGESTGANAGSTGPASMLSSSEISSSNRLRPLYFLMKVAEQDNMADTTALILVPSLLTLLAVFDKPSSGLNVLQEQWNMWLRCVCMFIGRLGGSYLAREIFTCKLKSRLRSATEELAASVALPETIDGLSARLWIQKLMLQDFHAQFWYLTAATLVVTFACFARVDLPLRFALLS